MITKCHVCGQILKRGLVVHVDGDYRHVHYGTCMAKLFVFKPELRTSQFWEDHTGEITAFGCENQANDVNGDNWPIALGRQWCPSVEDGTTWSNP